jgi:hypothetical protein
VIRTKVEIIPCGDHSQTETLFETITANDGRSFSTGFDSGGTGTYDVWDGEAPWMFDYPENQPNHVGTIGPTARDSTHRLRVAIYSLTCLLNRRLAEEDAEVDEELDAVACKTHVEDHLRETPKEGA